MKHYHYLIVGGGLTSDAAVRGIRELDADSSIGMISMEPDPPYTRPSLSKGLWKGRPVERIWHNPQDLGAELHLNRKVVQLDPKRKLIGDAYGDQYSYEILLLATGGSPIRLPFGEDHIIYYRDFQDYQRLRALTERGERFLVIGGGFIGSEMAAALTMIGKEVIMIFLEESIGANIYPRDLSLFLNEYYLEKGVKLVPKDAVVSLERFDDRFSVRTRSDQVFEVGGVVAGIGIRPNLELAQQAGLQIENGIAVDEQLRTSVQDIFAAGDVAAFHHSALGKRVRVEHEDNAVQMGRQAGRNMAGANESYRHIPMFYSDLFDLGYEAVGELSSRLETVSHWREPFKEGVVYYLEEGRVRGVLLWNVWGAVSTARDLLAESSPFDPAEPGFSRFFEGKAK